jgi:hypothetical protein
VSRLICPPRMTEPKSLGLVGWGITPCPPVR